MIYFELAANFCYFFQIAAILRRKKKEYFFKKLLLEILQSTIFLGTNVVGFLSAFCLCR